jgi:hypothetical protein
MSPETGLLPPVHSGLDHKFSKTPANQPLSAALGCPVNGLDRGKLLTAVPDVNGLIPARERGCTADLIMSDRNRSCRIVKGQGGS